MRHRLLPSGAKIPVDSDKRLQSYASFCEIHLMDFVKSIKGVWDQHYYNVFKDPLHNVLQLRPVKFQMIFGEFPY